MLTRTKSVALTVFLLGGAAVTFGAFAPRTSTSVAGLFTYDTACDICSVGEAHRQAVVTVNTSVEDDDHDHVSLVGEVDLAIDGATYDKTFGTCSPIDPCASSASADATGGDCNTWHVEADVKVETRVKVVATKPTIEIDIWTKSLDGANYQAHAQMDGTVGQVGICDAAARYNIASPDRLDVLVPFSIRGAATKIEVRQNKITRKQLGDNDDCDSPECQTLVTWRIYDEGDETNCVKGFTWIVTKSYTQSGAGNTGGDIFTITLPVQTEVYHYVLDVRYQTANAMGAGASCEDNSTNHLELEMDDHFELELEAIQ